MKNAVKFLAVATLGLLIGSAAFAGKPESSKSNVERSLLKELNKKLENEYANLSDKPEDQVTVVFKVEKENTVRLVDIKCENSALKSLVEATFSKNAINASAELEGKFYALPITFKKIDF
jgi:hypothetical protein